MKDDCKYIQPDYDELLIASLLGINQIREQLISLLRSISCEQCDDPVPLLCLIKETMDKEKELLTLIIEHFNHECFICSPLRILRQLFRSVSFLTIGIGNIGFIAKEINQDNIEFCELITPLADIIFEMDIIRKYLQNTEKEYKFN